MKCQDLFYNFAVSPYLRISVSPCLRVSVVEQFRLFRGSNVDEAGGTGHRNETASSGLKVV